jgi:splicing factor U2AF subunit
MGMLSDGKLSEDLMGLGLKGDQPVISVHLNYEKNYAFVEVRLFLLPPVFFPFLPH